MSAMIVKMIIGSSLPLSFVEDTNFRELLRYLEPKWVFVTFVYGELVLAFAAYINISFKSATFDADTNSGSLDAQCSEMPLCYI